MKLYEGMFLIDNDLVRESWQAAKSAVTNILTKHGATVHTARRWDERALAYPIRGRRRATFVLSYFEIDSDRNGELIRDFEIHTSVMRYLVTSASEVPEAERGASQAELADDFVVPPPPPDEVGGYQAIRGGDEDGTSEEEAPDVIDEDLSPVADDDSEEDAQ
jgi:small subunit ribosomal protein S6